MRRFSIAWSRRLLYVELFFGRLYSSLTKSPTWNFVAIVGTLGILLTILLFLVPWDVESSAAVDAKSRSLSKPAWELDARLASISTTNSDEYPIELLPASDRRRDRFTTLAKTEEVPARRSRISPQDEPILPEFAEEPISTRRRRASPETVLSFDDDWFDVKAKASPELGMDVEVVVAKKRSRREPIVADRDWIGRSLPPEIDVSSRKFRPDRNDPWTVSDPRQLARRDRNRFDVIDEDTIPASHADRPLGSAWQPVSFPTTAPSAVDVAVELSWNRRVTSRQAGPKLTVRNLSEETLARIDVLPGALPKFDQSIPTDLLTQVISNLTPQAQDTVALPIGAASRRSTQNLVSVLITTFVGGATRVIPEPVEPIAKSLPRELPDPPPRRRREVPREPDRPHLQMTVGKPGRLERMKMVSVPIRVVNDGNVPLSDVVILANIPATLEHEHGRHVHYRLGHLEPGQERKSTLLLTPREAGSTAVPLKAIDGDRLASADGEAGVYVSDDEFAEVQVRRSRLRRQAKAEPVDDFGQSPP